MPITVNHDINAGFYGLPFFAAQAQRAEQEQATIEAERQRRQQQLFNLVQGFAAPQQAPQAPYPGLPRRLIGQMNAGVPLQAPAPPVAPAAPAPSFDPLDKYKIDMDARTKRAAIMADSYGDQLAAQTSTANQWNNMMGGLLERQMMGEYGLAEQAMLGDQRMGLAQYDAAAEMAQQAYGDYPQWIVEGLNSGHLQYSPEQNTQRNKHQQAMAAARSNPSLSPEQRMTAIAMHAQAIRDINMHPEEVPPDQWPKTPQQIADELFVKGPDGQWGTIEVRNGEQRVVPWKSDAGQMEFKQAEFERKMQEKDEDQAFKVQSREEDQAFKRQQRQEDLQFRQQQRELDRQEAQRKFYMEGLQDQRQMEIDSIMMPEAPQKTGPDGKPVDDIEAQNKLQAEYQKKVSAIYKKYEGMAQAGGQQFDPSSVMATANMLPTQQQPPQDNAQIIGPNPAGRYARKYPDGRVELLPEGFAP